MAVINITPADDISMVIDTIANPGDVLLVEDGIYNQIVVATKNNIHIVARGNGAVFDGQDTLSIAFVLDGVSSVTVEGFTIINYEIVGIYINEGSSHRILRNRLVNAGVNGILLEGTTGNVVWRNEASGSGNGVLMASGSTPTGS